MRINILTARFGGPFQWGKDLAYMLNNSLIEAKHIHTLFDLPKSCLHQSVDIVHTTVPIPIKLWKKPIVFTVHGDYTIERNMWQRFIPKTITGADVITTPSQYLKEKLDLGKAIVIPNAVFPERFKLARHGPRDELSLVTVANFYFPDKVKGLLRMIGILSKLRNRKLKCTIIGGGRYLGTLKNQIDRTKVNVTFTGFLSDPMPALADADVFLYYSYHDNFPISILEAMACGLPVVTNSVGAVSEIIDNEENGYIAESYQSYLEYLSNLLADYELRHRVGQNARAKVEEKFSWHNVNREYIQIYNKLLTS